MLLKRQFIGALLISLMACSTQATDINVMTFNLRIPVDPAPYDWQSRLPRIISTIEHQHPDFLGVQEVTPSMLNDLRVAFSSYNSVGRGREINGEGEGTQILFLHDRWEADLQDQGTTQLSPTPDVVGSNGWNMQWPRIFTWVHLRDKHNGKFVYVFNTHFPLIPKERDLSAQLLASAIAERKHKNDPVILTGDFNACIEEASMNYLMGQSGSPIAMKEAYQVLHPADKTGSFHAFGTAEACKIDHIFVLGDVKPLSAKIITEKENFASDHFAVVAKLKRH